MTPITNRLKHEIECLETRKLEYMENRTTEEEYVSEVRQIAINLLLVIDGHVKLDDLMPMYDIHYKLKRGN